MLNCNRLPAAKLVLTIESLYTFATDKVVTFGEGPVGPVIDNPWAPVGPVKPVEPV